MHSAPPKHDFEHLRGLLVRALRRYLGDAAEDAAHEALARLFSRAEPKPSLARAIRIAVNASRDEARSASARQRRELEWTMLVATTEVEDLAWRFDVDRAVRMLPAPERQALVACDAFGLTAREAAQRFGIPIGTLKGRLARARAAIGHSPPPPGSRHWGGTPRTRRGRPGECDEPEVRNHCLLR